MTSTQAKRATDAALISLASTIVVVVIKLWAAALSHSISVLAEGLQSIMDILMSLVAVGTLRIASRPADDKHPYGHGKAELLSSALQMIVILLSGAYILWQAFSRWNSPQPIEWNYGVAAMAYALVANTAVGIYLSKVARETGSNALVAEALHLRGDSLSSLGVLVGMILVGMTGILRFDSGTAALFTLIAMAQAGVHLGRMVHPLMDGALPAAEIAALEAQLKSHPMVRGYHNLRCRSVGTLRFIELHVLLEDSLSFVEAHDLAEVIEDEIRTSIGGGVVNIHYEPFEAEMMHQEKAHGKSRAALHPGPSEPK